MNHYFLVASLPALKLGERPGVTKEDFLLRAAEQLGAGEMATLTRVLDGNFSAGGDAFAAEWRAFDIRLRNACARQRAARMGVDAVPHLREPRDGDLMTEATVAAAFNARDPLERERALDAIRWAELERLAGFDPFTFRALLAYALRLDLAWRWSGMETGRGRETAARLAGMTQPEPIGTP